MVKDKTACGINEFGNDPDGPISEDEYDETYHVPETLAPLDYLSPPQLIFVLSGSAEYCFK